EDGERPDGETDAGDRVERDLARDRRRGGGVHVARVLFRVSDDDRASRQAVPGRSSDEKTTSVAAKARAGWLAQRLCGAEERRPRGQRAQRASPSDLPRLFERSERSER